MQKEKPVHEVRLGAIKAAIWKNDTQNGVRYNTTFSRIYRDGEEWKNTDSFGREDLLVLGKVADVAHTWIHAQGQAQGQGQEERERDDNRDRDVRDVRDNRDNRDNRDDRGKRPNQR